MSESINYINLKDIGTFSYNKKIPIGTRLDYNDIVAHSFKIANNFSHQELLIKTELKMYEEIGLDPTKTHKISYIEKIEVSDSEVLLEAFAIDKDMISKKYQNTLKSVKHIDFLAIPFLIFETLYTNKILIPKNDIFVYIGIDEAFTTSYKDGKYISSKKIKSINNMIRDLESRNITISSEELQEIISTKGTLKANYELLQYGIFEYLEETFDELFSKIKNLSLHNRNVYNFSQIDRLFFSCSKNGIPNLKEQVQSYIGDGEFLKLDFLKIEGVDVIDSICASYIKDKISQKDNDHNVTIFLKKDPFYKSEVGKFAFGAAAGIMIAIAYPVYLQEQIMIKNADNEVLSEREAVISKSSKKYQKELKSLTQELASVTVKQQDDLKKLKTLQGIANSLLELKSKDTQYTAMFLKINKILKNYKLSIDKITQADSHALNLELSSKDSKRDTIALLMKDLIDTGFSSVTSNEIILGNDDMYKSIVTVKR